MPELPEVETIVRTLRPSLLGRQFDALRVIRKDIVRPLGADLGSKALHRTIVRLLRRGKKIVFEFDDAARFYIHLGMSGRLTLDRPDAAIRPHTHMILQFGQQELRFVDPRRFGGVFWLGTDQPADSDLGPEPLKMSARQLAARLAKTRRAIKTALLDQKLLAGLGNIYADESLFAAGIDPRTAADKLSRAEISRLNRSIKAVLNRAIRHRGSTLRDYRDANGLPGDFQKIHRVYDRAGKPCLVCRTPIERIVLGGRSTHFCPKCQRNKKAPNVHPEHRKS
ncbi:MAG TPA: bifunctional DNA-formamidopyrimidine glycosylase/DNA-(apurinic or apyrimidinic site) lyase [Tepidisphaeraceae bacterium]|nr:bifunctional DNA-formamidopyrimidine glycosylase/DNA-(apurinic or apyrimidinic site) lyase [Tepidisphaeraceae bacterium]